MTEHERALGWDDEIEDTGPSFVLLPPGDYDFEIVHWERSRYEGSTREGGLPPCPMAIVKVRLFAPDGQTTTVEHRLFLHSRTQGFLYDFFVALGLMERGEKATMPWNQIVGRTGRCKVKVRTWTGQDGKERQSNEIERFYEPNESTRAGGTTYQAGSF